MKIITAIKVVIGFVALGLGTIGMFVPVLPTTPFVLLAVGCFSTTPKLRARVLKIRFFNEYYESYINGNGLKKKTVISSLTFLWVMLIISCMVTQKLWITLLLMAIGIAVTLHILYISKERKNR